LLPFFEFLFFQKGASLFLAIYATRPVRVIKSINKGILVKFQKLSVVFIFALIFSCSPTYGMCKLKNGKMCPKPVVLTMRPLLELAAAQNFIAFFDLVEKCKNPNYSYPPCGPKIGGKKSIEYLHRLKLVDEDGNVDQSCVRDIVLSSVVGDSFDLKLVDPVECDYTEKEDYAPIQFCIPAPMDEYWNTGMPECVLEVKDEDPIDSWGSLTVIAPESFRSSWSSICKKYVIRCTGPAQERLPFEGYVRFIHDLRPDLPLPKGLTLE